MGMFEAMMKKMEEMNSGAQKAKKRVQGTSDTTKQPDMAQEQENVFQKKKKALKEIEDAIDRGSR